MFGWVRRLLRVIRRPTPIRASANHCHPTLESLEGREVPAIVVRWNRALLDAIRAERTAPPIASRNLAILHVAMFDAVNSVTHHFTPYKVNLQADPSTSTEAAASTAAFRVAKSLFPNEGTAFAALQRRILARTPDTFEEVAGILLGRQVANRILKLRAQDGASSVVSYTPGTQPGDWQPTPPAFARSLLPQWPGVTPFAMTGGAQFRPGNPPALTSQGYTNAFNEVKSLGEDDSATRTADQTQIALFWADGAGTATPPGHWNEITQDLALRRNLSLEDEARLFALVNVAMADAGISSWDAKYAYNLWRPITAIQRAGTDGNPDTTADATWRSLIATPPFPSFTSGHSTFSSAAATVLRRFFGRDLPFTTTSDGLPGVVRAYNSFEQAAAEAGQSRIYGGIHYQFDNQDALAAGRSLGNLVFRKFLRPV